MLPVLFRNVVFGILLNKRDLPDVFSVDQVKEVLRELHLWSDDPDQAEKNPNIYETIALYGTKQNIYESFTDCAHRTVAHMV